MPKAYSGDLRVRVIEMVQAGPRQQSPPASPGPRRKILTRTRLTLPPTP